MDELNKIRDVSSKYDISSRALRYYEDMGLITSTRSQDYAYRLYDNVEDIDGEVALLGELKEIILEFIRLIKQADFSRDSDIKMLYEKTSKIENHIINITYDGNPSKTNVSRLLEVTEKLMYGAPDFLWFEEDMKAVWIWAVEDWVTEKDTAPYELIEFEGGLYAAAMSIDGDDDIGGRVYSGIKKWLETSGFELDERPGHRTMCHMVNPTDEIKAALGYHQLDMYVPIKIRKR